MLRRKKTAALLQSRLETGQPVAGYRVMAVGRQEGRMRDSLREEMADGCPGDFFIIRIHAAATYSF